MGWYGDKVVPFLVDRGMRVEALDQQRPRVAPRARGRVLELGCGAGLNIPLYGNEVEHLWCLEPSSVLLNKSRELAAGIERPVEFIDASAEDIPLDNDAVDSVVSTWTLCSIPDVESALQEVRRVLKPGGRFYFIEHGLAPDASVQRWQHRLAPVFRGLAGCNPDRPMRQLLEEAGFEFPDLETEYLDGPRFIAYHYTGSATPRR